MRRLLLTMMFALLLAAVPASADTTLGALYTGPYEPNAGNGYGTQCGDTESIYYESDWASVGNPYAAPSDGRITSWTVAELPAGTTFRLAILAPSDANRVWTIERRSAAETIPSGGGALTFSTDLPVATGQEIALDGVNVFGQGTCIFPTDENDFKTSTLDDRQPDGSTQSTDGTAMGTLVNVEATFTTAPEPTPSGSTGGSSGATGSPQEPSPTGSPEVSGRSLSLRLASRLAERALHRLSRHTSRRAVKRCARHSSSNVYCRVAWRTRSTSAHGGVDVVRRSTTRWSAHLTLTEHPLNCRTAGCTHRVVRRWAGMRV